jgi:hypothetical protein
MTRHEAEAFKRQYEPVVLGRLLFKDDPDSIIDIVKLVQLGNNKFELVVCHHPRRLDLVDFVLPLMQ